MTSEYEQEQPDRDVGLIRRLCYVQDSQSGHIHTWMQEELEALRLRAQLLRVMPLSSDAKKELATCEGAIARVYEREMLEAFKRFSERRAEVESGLYDDPLQSEQYLNDGLRAILDLMRSVMGIRSQLDKFWKECTTEPRGD